VRARAGVGEREAEQREEAGGGGCERDKAKEGPSGHEVEKRPCWAFLTSLPKVDLVF